MFLGEFSLLSLPVVLVCAVQIVDVMRKAKQLEE
jgi:hypothetical protein